MIEGKKPPQATDLEEAVLGALMLDKEAAEDFIPKLKVEHFYNPANQFIYAGMLDLMLDNKAIDILTLTTKLRALGTLEKAGGPLYLAKLTSRVSSSANLENHYHIIYQQYMRRAMIIAAGDVINKSYDDTEDVFDVKAELVRKVEDLDSVSASDISAIDDVLEDVQEHTMMIHNSGSECTGIPTGSKKINEITHGWQPSDLIIIAARPGMGKTALAVTLLTNIAKSGIPVGIFSLEMPKRQLGQRVMSMCTGIPLEKLRSGILYAEDIEALKNYKSKTRKLPIFIDDRPALSVLELKAKARKLVRRKGVRAIVIDYLQLMRGEMGNKNSNREQEISYISRSLKALAKELDIPIIALAQLSRAVEQRADKRPQLSDLRESGSIEQDADIVGFLYREAYYKEKDQGIPEDSLSELIFAKHRNGRLGFIEMHYIGALTMFQDEPPGLPDFNYEPPGYTAPDVSMQDVGRRLVESDETDEYSLPFKND